jgi:type IV secretory pathway VirB9-like protein
MAFAPWEMEADTFSERSYERFLRREVTRRMQDESVTAYHASVLDLRFVFPQDDVFRLTQELHRKREMSQVVTNQPDGNETPEGEWAR